MLNNGYNNWLGTACLRGISVCVYVCVWLSICMCACWFLNDCTRELSLRACRLLRHSRYVSAQPAGTRAVQRVHLCVFGIESLSVINSQRLTYFLWLLWHSWWGRRRFKGIAPTNLEKHDSLSVMRFPAKPPSRQTCRGSHSTFDWWLLLLSALMPMIF